MNIIETSHFVVKYSDKDKNILCQITDLIEKTYISIMDKFELTSDEKKFEFVLCSDVREFIKETGKSPYEYQEWMVGNANYEKRKLCILSPRVVTDRSYDDMLSVIKHEIVHVAFDQLQSTDEANLMIAEGIAVAYANQIDISSLNEAEYPDAIKLSDENYFYENDGYNYSGIYVLHLIKMYGIDAFKDIYAGREKIDKYLYKGFEREAIKERINNL